MGWPLKGTEPWTSKLELLEWMCVIGGKFTASDPEYGAVDNTWTIPVCVVFYSFKGRRYDEGPRKAGSVHGARGGRLKFLNMVA